MRRAPPPDGRRIHADDALVRGGHLIGSDRERVFLARAKSVDGSSRAGGRRQRGGRRPRGAGSRIHPERLANLRDTILRSKLLSRRLVSDDGTTTAVLADMRTPASVATIAEESEAIDAVRKAIERRPPPPGLITTITGGPSVEAGVARSIVHDLFVMTPASLVVILIALVVTFRSAHGVLLAMATLIVSVLWTAGLYGLIGRPIDLLGNRQPGGHSRLWRRRSHIRPDAVLQQARGHRVA